ncbi:hypothetical protein [Mycoplasma marinum]|uniref:Uncharacterized protein n=1 Tax=Mycoplasma marinum TaxID=1937190 RepID=A0A4R0XKZ3_9MOLU|nr:hypothetical protein [Mycoplasma marinum]TCG11326.1 hypothetical protein C4B24_02125 [Mycoplasma marinum]
MNLENINSIGSNAFKDSNFKKITILNNEHKVVDIQKSSLGNLTNNTHIKVNDETLKSFVSNKVLTNANYGFKFNTIYVNKKLYHYRGI